MFMAWDFLSEKHNAPLWEQLVVAVKLDRDFDRHGAYNGKRKRG